MRNKDVKDNLTSQEQEIWKYVCKGHGKLEISELLDISSHTVKSQILAIIRKSGIKNREGLSYFENFL